MLSAPPPITPPVAADPLSLVEGGASLAAYYSAMFSPAEPRLVATANSKTGAAVYDVAMPGKYVQLVLLYLFVI